MKALLVGEVREGILTDSTYELIGFAGLMGWESALVLAGPVSRLPEFTGRLYQADPASCREYDPDQHKRLVLAACEREGADAVVLLHSSCGWDLAPRLAVALGAAQISEAAAAGRDGFEVCCCGGKMRRTVRHLTGKVVITIQAGAFAALRSGGSPDVELIAAEPDRAMSFSGYEPSDDRSVDLGRAAVIVAAGRGVGNPETLAAVTALAGQLGGEMAASRPVVDMGWLERGRQVGTTGQSVSPKLYLACGVSGAIQHVAGIRRSDFIVAVNRDRDAPIGEVADVLVVADVSKFVPALVSRLNERC